MDISSLKTISQKLRANILQMITKAKSGHPGGSLSAIDLIVFLYERILKYDAKNPSWELRDRFVLSKGHGVPALYAMLAHKKVFNEDLLATFRNLNSPLQGHPANSLLPGIEASTGSLGQGLSIAVGMALAATIENNEKPLYKVYALLGDGEMQEGQVWEALLSINKFKLTNLVTIVDYNKAQIDGTISQVMPIEPIVNKLQSFGLNVIEIDGHNFAEMKEAFAKIEDANKPCAIVAHTIKGKGVSFLEKDIVAWHGKALSDDELAQALEELGR